MQIKMKPVCDCGYIFDSLLVAPSTDYEYILILGKPSLLAPMVVDPCVCPQCRSKIESVVNQVPVDGRFDYDVKKYM